MTRLLDALQSIPYELELRDTVDCALYRLGQFDSACKKCLRIRRRKAKMLRVDPRLSREQLDAQTEIFDSLEGFLAAYARVSVLIFPSRVSGFAKRRAATLQQCLGLNEHSPLARRDLRDAWVHHDERLDRAVEHNRGASGQVFTVKADVNASVRRTFLRIIEMDTRRIRFRHSNGRLRVIDLAAFRRALEKVDRDRKCGFAALSMPFAARRKSGGKML